MALPIREKEVRIRTVEELLMDRIVKAIEAKDYGDEQVFDEIIESLEMIMKLKPSLYNELMVFKAELIEQTRQVMAQVEELAAGARNQIQRRVFLEGEASSVEWDARKDYFEKIIEIMGNNQLIPMSVQEPASIESFDTVEETEKQVENIKKEEEQVQEEPKVTESPEKDKKKPKLTFQKPKRFDV